MAKRFDINKIIGTKINSLLILSETEIHITSGGNKHRTIICKCDCGKIKKIQLSSVTNNITKSCGCYSASLAKIRMKTINKKHGETLTSEYNTWCSMKKRCNNIKHKAYKYYGNLGIKVCDRWLNSYENFIEDMGRKPFKEYSLDRIDGTKGYCKENCRWATNKEQCRNLKNNVLFEYNNEIKCIGEWCEILKLTRYKTIKVLKENGKIIY
jgi:hypothetical protein